MMKKARIPLVNEKIRPCRSVESVGYKLGNTKPTRAKFLQGGLVDPWFSIVIRILNPRFKETIQHKAVDIETLIGYIGGYIGILTGFALIQIPDIIAYLFKCTKMFLQYLKKCSK